MCIPSQQGFHDFGCHSRQRCRDTVHHLEKEQKLEFANVEVHPPAGSCREQKSQPAAYAFGSAARYTEVNH